MAMDTYSEVPLTMMTAGRLETGLMAACTRAVMHGRAAWTYSADTPWTAWATATPLRDIEAANEGCPRDLSRDVLFDGDALVYVNGSTLYHLLKNANGDDLWGQRNAASATSAVHPVNSVLRGLNVPQVAVYDKGYLLPVDEGAFHLFIPDGVALMIDKTFTHIVKMVVF
jgi:hypothetical protein